MADVFNGPEFGRLFNEARVRRISRSAYTKFDQREQRIGTWNFRSMKEDGKINNTIMEMQRLNICILGISEMRCPGNGKSCVDGYHIYHSGDESSRNRNGVAFIISKEINDAIISVTPHNDRMMIIQLQGTRTRINIIQVYAPTSECEEEVIETFYSQLVELMKLTKNNEITFIMGDFNAKIVKV